MYYGGMDAHKSYLTLVVVDKDGERVHRQARIPAGNGETLMEALADFRPLEVVVETCPFWPWIHDRLQGTDIGFHLAHASRLEAIARSKKKTDKVDAELMARMLLAGLIPEVYPKPADQREKCYLIRHRASLVRDRTRCCNRIHNHLMHRGLQLPREQLLRKAARQWLEDTAWPELSEEQRRSVECHLEFIELLSVQIQEFDERIEERAGQCPAAALLQSIPGIGPYRSLLLVGEISPIQRFPTAKHLVSFAGLAPTVRQSGPKDPYHGRIPKGANRWVRGALVSAIPSHMNATPDSSLGQYYQKQKERVGWRTARVAAARKLCRAIRAMLRSGELWRG